MKFIECIWTIIFIIVLPTICESAKILYVMPFTAKSHYIGMKDLAIELAKRGHEVYVITPYREEVHPLTYHQLMVEPVSFWSRMFDKPIDVFSTTDMAFTSYQQLLYNSGFLVNELVYNSTDVTRMMKENHHFDLIISEVFFNEMFYMFSHVYKAPLILVTTFGNSLKTNFWARNPLQLATQFHEYGIHYDPLSFFGRLWNLYICTYDLLVLKFWYFPKQLEHAKSYFKLKDPVPTLEDIAANTSLVLMNSHYSIDTPAAYLPNFIQVGGLHIKSTNVTLPPDLQKILDNATSGVVFLSLGSNVRSVDLSKEKLGAFLKVFGELKQTVLMKWEYTTLPEVPSNVILRQWFPQKQVLEHPNIKLFIGHGGFLGLQEAIYAGVPILGIPVYGDQYLNLLQAKQGGYGEILEHKEISEETIRNLVFKMVEDKRYLTKAKEISVVFKDRPMSAMETAVWWTEYVLRHKGADFMKASSLKLDFLAYNMMDILAFLVIILIGILFLIVSLSKILFGMLFSKKQIRKQKKH